MTTMEAVASLRRGTPVRWRSWLHPTSLAAIAIAGAVAIGGWALSERPVKIVDYHGAIGGFAFSPYQRGQSAETNTYPSEAQVRADLQLIAGQTGQIRTYSTENVLGRIPALAADMHLPLKITAGAWIDGHPKEDQGQIDDLIRIANGNGNVDRVLVGNETLLRADVSLDQLVADINEVRAGVHVPVSTAEPTWVWLDKKDGPALAGAVDYITIHILPYWENQPIDKAVDFSLDQLAQVQRLYPGKKVVIGEVGWPSDGVDQGPARASRVNQAKFMREFMVQAQARHLDYFVMEAFDQPWKTTFEGRAAGYWGMLDLDRQAKWSLTGAVVETPHWLRWALPASLVAALFSLVLLSRRPDIRFPGKLAFAGLTQGFVTVMGCVLLAMAGKYMSLVEGLVWGGLALGQALLLVLLIADSFELAETVWGRVWRRRLTPIPVASTALLPKVSIHIPICNEPPHMVRQTLDALADLDYPDFEVLVIDNNTKDPALWEPVAEHCARLGARFRFFHLGKWPGYKAGALNFALRETAPDAEVIGVLDSDYVVAPDWLRCMVPQFNDPRIGFVQSPQDYRDNDGSLFKRLMFWEYAGFFQLGMVTRNERNAVIQHGTMTLVRKSALVSTKGWAEWCITEDSELGMKLFRDGWLAAYSSKSFGRGVMPDDFAAYRKQRHRWAYGAMHISRAHIAALFSPFDRTLTLGQRWHFVTGWLPWVGDALGLVFLLMGLVWSVGLTLEPKVYGFPIALFMLPSILMFGFKLMQIMLLYGARVPCKVGDRLAAALGGLALSHTIGKAVWSGIFTSKAPFLRTPKMKDAPALVQGLVMAREELLLLTLTWAALAAVGISHQVFTGYGNWEATLWCAVLAVQSLPYLASVVVSVIAALPAPRKVDFPASLPAPSQHQHQPALASILARSGAGD